MEKLKQYKYIMITILVIFSIAFYWFGYRPTQIKERCYTEAEFDNRAISEVNDSKRQEFINSYYDDCLKRFGL